VDLFDSTLTVQRQSTKTDAGNRVIPLNQTAVLTLVELKDRAQKLGSSGPEHYVFPACEGGVIDPRKPMKGWRTALRHLTKEAGLKGLRFHDLRHQAITELCEAGLSLPGMSHERCWLTTRTFAYRQNDRPWRHWKWPRCNKHRSAKQNA
jgi:integrase